MTAALHKDGLAGSTTVIVTAKHGQSPRNPTQARHRPGRSRSSTRSTPHGGQTHPDNTSLIVAGTNDDLWQSYLSDNSQAAATSSSATCGTTPPRGTTSTITRSPSATPDSPRSGPASRRRTSSGSLHDGRNPDVFGRVQVGVVYAKPTKLAEHGGMNRADRHVLMIVDGPGVPARVRTARVETTQVAPTILALLGLDPNQLTAVQTEGTQVLPGVVRHSGGSRR